MISSVRKISFWFVQKRFHHDNRQLRVKIEVIAEYVTVNFAAIACK